MHCQREFSNFDGNIAGCINEFPSRAHLKGLKVRRFLALLNNLTDRTLSL